MHAALAMQVSRGHGSIPRRRVRGAVALTAAAVFTIWLLTGAGGETLTTWVDDLGEFGAAAAAAVACGLAAHRGGGRDRLTWALIAASCAMWAGGQLVWSWIELVSEANPFPSVADVGFLGAVPLMIAGLLSFPRLLRGAVARLQAGLDGLIIATALLVISWATALGGVYTSSADGAWTLALSLAYPAGDIAIITVALVLATRARSTSRAPLVLLAAGVSALALSDSSFAYATAMGSDVAVGLDWGWFAGFLLIALAALEATERRGMVPSRTPLPAGARSASLYLVVAAAMAIIAWHLVREGGLDTVLFVSLLILTALTFLREVLAVLSSAGVLRRLVHDSLTGLPDRGLLRARIDDALCSSGGECTLLFIDLDDFSGVNGRLGRAAGDLLLGVIGRRLNAAVHPPDLAVHLGADRFAALLDAGVDREDALEVAARIQEALERPIEIDGQIVSLTTTVGVIRGAHAGRDAQEMIARAEEAALAGKVSGRHALVVVEPSLGDVMGGIVEA